jgi:hypothetical protein
MNIKDNSDYLYVQMLGYCQCLVYKIFFAFKIMNLKLFFHKKISFLISIFTDYALSHDVSQIGMDDKRGCNTSVKSPHASHRLF